MKKKLIVGGMLSAVLAAVFASGYAAASSEGSPIYRLVRSVYLWQRTTDISKNDHWRTKVDEFSHYDGHAEIVMLGDSLTENALWQELFPKLSIINRGISGDGVAGVLLRLDQITAARPQIVFIMLGVNDIRAYADADDVAEAYGHVIKGLAGVDQIVVQSTLFTSGEAKNNAAIKRLNDALAVLCDSAPNCRYLDLNALLSKDGALQRDFTIDGLHLNGNGYRVWASEIGPLMVPRTGV
ncbi:GDSL-type esterase/lipase family protein [Mesorhizobium sp. M0983]|uniref:GDSL-type esterase/lipase family protein n=1 Tax=Mesorhizobium sp. M0983 TaxID=2957040 RepID=UPI0033382F2D